MNQFTLIKCMRLLKPHTQLLDISLQDPSFPTIGVNVGIPDQTVVDPFTGIETDGATKKEAPYGQTLPVRVSNPPDHQQLGCGDGQANTTDGKMLMSFLQSADVVNFFGAGHGLGTSFMGAFNLGAFDWAQVHHRYRFVFLDGCHTACSGLLRDSFGAEKPELESPAPLDMDWYKDATKNLYKRLRPAAFLAFKTDTIIRYKMNDKYADPVTGLECWWRDYEIYSAWHEAVVKGWTLDNKSLLTSVNDANNQITSAPNSFPRWAGSNPGWTKRVYDCNGTPVTPFKPDSTCLKFAGCGGLKFSGPDSYNKKADWQQP